MDADKIKRLEIFDSLIETPMTPECKFCVVIPAHNESANICSLINEINSQVFSKDSYTGFDQFEVIIVDNNSEDNTAEVAAKYIYENNVAMKINIVSTVLTGKEKGSIGAVRKIGSDLSLYRLLKSSTGNINEFYIIAIDADNSIPNTHFENIVQTFRQTKADTLAGYGTFDVEVFNSDQELYKLAKSIDKYIYRIFDKKPLAHRVLGPNHAITAEMYLKIGGYPVWQLAEDINMGIETERLGGKIAWLNSPIKLNMRRSKVNPFEIITREAWGRDQFSSGEISQLIRSDHKVKKNYTREYIKKSLTAFIDDTVAEVSMSREIPLKDAIFSERRDFANICQQFDVDIKTVPDFGLFKIDKFNPVIYRKWASNDVKVQLFNGSIQLVKEVTEGINVQICGEPALWVLSEGTYIPDMVNICIFKSEFEKLLKNLEKNNSGLFLVTYQNKLRFYERIFNKVEGLDSKSVCYVLNVDQNGVPDYNGPCFKLNFIMLDGSEMIYDNYGLLRMNKDLFLPVCDYNGLNVMNKISLLLLSKYENRSNGFINISALDEKEKSIYDQIVNNFLNNCVTFLCAKYLRLSEEREEGKENETAEFLVNLFGIYKTKKEMRQHLEVKDKLLNILHDKIDDKKVIYTEFYRILDDSIHYMFY